MTNEKMLELLNEYLKNDNVTKLTDLKNGLIENIRVEIEKSKGTKVKDISVMKKVMKDVESNIDEKFCGYHPFNFNDKEYNGFCNGHFIFASINNFGYEKAKEILPIDKFFYDNCFEKNDKNIEIKVDLKDIKLFIKTHKKADKKPYIIDTGDFKIGINPYYLQNALEFCNTDTVYITDTKSPFFIKADDYEKVALVLPIRIVEK